MSIGIGIHCWFCEHGPCNDECRNYEEPEQPKELSEDEKLKQIIINAFTEGMNYANIPLPQTFDYPAERYGNYIITEIKNKRK